MTRITISENRKQFLTHIGEAKPWMFQNKKQEHTYVKTIYCSDCVATHEEGKHLNEK